MLKTVITNLSNLMARARGLRYPRRQRAMQLCETLPIGERRFLLLVKVEEQKFLVGAAGSSISLLAKLPPPQDSQVRMEPVDDDALLDSKEYGA